MQRYRFVADLSDLKSIFGAEAPDILIVSGFAVPEQNVLSMLNAVATAKLEVCGNELAPVKWNLRDLSRALKLHSLEGLQDALLKNAEPLRAGVLKAVRGSGVTLFSSVLQAYSNKKQVLCNGRSDLIEFAFQNLLQRFAFFSKSGVEPGSRVHLDWPEKNQHQPFSDVYMRAWRDGPGFGLPSLRKLGFEPALSFGVTDADPLLQAADLVVGIVRSFTAFAQGAAGPSEFGVQQFRLAIPSFYQSPKGKLEGFGVVVSPASCTLASLLASARLTLQGGSA